ncbi:hypothetical protein BDP81DRAFT_82921 [Colletotrichum phormii]|uniref:Uncharacterized protein n=1 Tax=Colletotrichum phormii TaxID=359342 RepID=A0AAJ0A0W4_9PEZI|nr:uncharacterized protein BDP81DRAFT_82921 [Colletotrichum phormii]KAK1654410.1 hypothetical protein BDP81DRAFT_82921 [Colletotrichum phormii]
MIHDPFILYVLSQIISLSLQHHDTISTAAAPPWLLAFGSLSRPPRRRSMHHAPSIQPISSSDFSRAVFPDQLRELPKAAVVIVGAKTPWSKNHYGIYGNRVVRTGSGTNGSASEDQGDRKFESQTNKSSSDPMCSGLRLVGALRYLSRSAQNSELVMATCRLPAEPGIPLDPSLRPEP